MRIKRDEVAWLAGERTAVKVALMVVPFYKASTDRNKLKESMLSIEEAEKRSVNLLTGLNPKPDWSCLWYLPRRLQEPHSYDDDRYEIYPCLAMVAKVVGSLSL